MLQFHVHSLDSKFFPQIVHKRCFYLGSSGPQPTSKPVSSQCGLDKNLSRGSRELTGLFVDCRPQATLAGLILVTRHTMQSVNWSTAESLVRNSEADREHSFVSNIVTKRFSLNTQNEKQKPQLGLSTSCSATFWQLIVFRATFFVASNFLHSEQFL